MRSTILLTSLLCFSSALADGYDWEMQEDFKPHNRVVVYDKVHIRECPSLDCKISAIGKEGDVYFATGVTSDGKWHQLEGENFIRDYLTKKEDEVNKSELTKDALKDIIANKFKNEKSVTTVSVKNTTDKEEKKHAQPKKIETTVPHESDSLYIHSPELAEKYKNDALIANLTQASSPKPIMKAPRYARVLIFPILNEKGDVYYDYNYAWVKVKDESFVLGQREGKDISNGFFSIHKKVK